jgi:hypothetical protein
MDVIIMISQKGRLCLKGDSEGGGFGFLFSSSRKHKTYVYEEESDVNYVERTRFPGQGID